MRRVLLVISLSGLVLYYGTAAAGAATTTHAATAASRPYCTAEANSIGSTKVPVATCYSTFAQAIYAATKGRVRLPASARTVTQRQLDAGPTTASSSYVISIDYSETNFGGSSLIWSKSYICGYFYTSSMPAGWNDVVSSVITFNGCASTVYQNTGFSGATYQIPIDSAKASLGTVTKQVSSQIWCAVNPC